MSSSLASLLSTSLSSVRRSQFSLFFLQPLSSGEHVSNSLDIAYTRNRNCGEKEEKKSGPLCYSVRVYKHIASTLVTVTHLVKGIADVIYVFHLHVRQAGAVFSVHNVL